MDCLTGNVSFPTARSIERSASIAGSEMWGAILTMRSRIDAEDRFPRTDTMGFGDERRVEPAIGL